MRESGEALVKSLGIGKGMRVLDLGCGDGATAIPAAQAGAEVVGVDIARHLVAAGNARAHALKLSNIHFQEGDASNLANLESKSFDRVVSIFGAMFVPRPFDVAREMVCVPNPAARSSWGTGYPATPPWWRRFSGARPIRRHRRKTSSAR